jgi:hypothetical protein
MATKKKTTRSGARSAGTVLRETWETVLKQLSVAEAELQKQVRSVIDGDGLGADAAQRLRDLGDRLEKERRRVAREIESRMGDFGDRVKKEGATVSRAMDDAVRKGLAALNIPSRDEISELTRKVDNLTRKIDGVGSRPAASRRPAAARKATVKKAAARKTAARR